MTPKEVGGLQALAMANGGSLTINPETGLPEAGFLKKLLPMIAGFALAPLTAGTSLAFLGATPLASALTVGGITGLATGSLKQGLMAGLGAYGGAGLGAGLAKTGAAAAGAGGAGTGAVAPSAANEAAKQGIFGSSTTNVAARLPAIGGSANTGVMASGVSPVATTTLPAAAPALSSSVASTAAPSMTGNLSAGVKALGQEGGFGNLYEALPQGTLPALGATLASAMQPKGITPKKEAGMIRPYEYTRTQNQGVYDMGAPIYSATPGSSAEKNYFTDSYTALTPYAAPGPEYPKAADGGLVALAVGGPVETMSAMNAVGGNMMYPQANLQTALYSNPMVQRPESVNVISPGEGPAVGAYTGEQKFARGGVTEPETTGGYQYSYDPRTMQFTQLSAPKPAKNFGPFNLIGRALAAGINTPQSTPANGTVSGGMAQPAAAPAPAIAAQPAQPAYTPPPIPEYQTPEQQLGLSNFYSSMDRQLAGLQGLGGYDGYAAGGGVSHLGDYSDGGRLLKGPGDGVSDSIPAVIGQRQPARLADGEFVVPARIVSELGNGSTEAGARKLYAMMDRVQKARRKTVGKDRVAANTKSEKYLPA
jgi:hypothetical protein